MRFAPAVALLSVASTAWAGSQYEPAAPNGMPAYGAPEQVYETPQYNNKVAKETPVYQADDNQYQPVQTPSSGSAKKHTVVVGGAGLVFNPPQVSAAVGDVVHFVMLAKNHTVTQSSFAKPCVRLATGLDSGFLPNEANDTASAPTFMVTVDSSEPTWWYCRQRQPSPHCGSGMVFAINPTADKSFDAFQRMAIQQNGTDAAPPPPPQGGGGGKGTVTLSVDNSGLPPPPPTATQDAGRPAQTALAPGWNNGGNPSACNCACFCGAAAFPAGSGIGSYGGYGGSMPAPWG